MRTLLIVFLLIAMPSLAVADEYTIGDLAVTYDPARWAFKQTVEGDPLRALPAEFEARCVACRGDAVVSISVGDVAREESEAVLDPAWAHNRREIKMTVGELDVAITQIDSPCRNLVPSSMTARAAYRGKTYVFRSGAPGGCRGSYGVGSERFNELLRGLHRRGNVTP